MFTEAKHVFICQDIYIYLLLFGNAIMKKWFPQANMNLPSVSCPGIERVRGRQKGRPEEMLTGGK